MTKQIPLTQGKFALVDDEDYEELMKYKWYFDNGYARRDGPAPIKKRILMHRQIMNAKAGQDVDHINHDGLDNRRINIRLCTTSQNMQNSKLYKNNSTGLKGVRFHKRMKKYQASIRINGKAKHLGTFENPIDAAKVYNEAALKLFGEFANFNKI